MTMGPMDGQALQQLGAKVQSQELLRRRRDELSAVRAERSAVALRILEREAAQAEDLTTLRALDERAGYLQGYLEARKLGAGQ